MTITLELTPEELTLLTRRAEISGATIVAVLHDLIATLAQPPTSPSTTPAAGMLPLSPHGETIDDLEDRAEWEREQAEMRANVARWRAEQGLGEGR